ncbi:phosphoadenylyl-sulfate reductase [Pollutimonas subterranea]|uniref:Adenosine 5'-phosphosulfate reductase n=1 Tax=Pollutimonas subterranea TaxID=2045210 RepID=A0A2N4U2M8_9BURK|nr:phosphoadenylyl-sulfate reductase [Pollutimonas subterranea]
MSTLHPPPDFDTRHSWRLLLETLEAISARHADAVFASSFGAEDMLLTHAIFESGVPIQVFTLDTGRLPAETVAMIDVVKQRYGVAIQVLKPDESAVQAHVAKHGEFGFYESVELRKACCAIRKVQPLRLALKGRSAWLTGQRREQSLTRADLADAEYDNVFGLQKYNPLAAWTDTEVWSMIRAMAIPYNPLHDKGYPSIGCEPCTRALRPGEDLRAGRWWWEQKLSKECGLHAGNLPGS